MSDVWWFVVTRMVTYRPYDIVICCFGGPSFLGRCCLFYSRGSYVVVDGAWLVDEATDGSWMPFRLSVADGFISKFENI